MPRIAGHRRRLPVSETPSTSRPWQQVSEHQRQGMASDVVLDLAWGRLVFGQTFSSLEGIVKALRSEDSGRRDICIYPRDPHVMVGMAPDELFIDPSYVYRLDLHRYRPRAELIRGVFVRTVTALVNSDSDSRVSTVRPPSDSRISPHSASLTSTRTPRSSASSAMIRA